MANFTPKIHAVSDQLQFFILLVTAKNKLIHHFEGVFSDISFNEFMILNYLDHSFEKKSRRVNLAKKVGISQPAITRILAKMERQEWLANDLTSRDTRTRSVTLTDAGHQKLHQTLERAEAISQQLSTGLNVKAFLDCSSLLKIINSNAYF